MGDIVQLHNAVYCSENAVTDTYYETLYPSTKEEEEYANILSFTDKTADVSKKENKQIDQAYMSPKVISDDAILRRLKMLYIVLIIMIFISTTTVITLIHMLVSNL